MSSPERLYLGRELDVPRRFATSPKDQDAESVVSNPYGWFTDTRFNTITIDEPILLAGGGQFFGSVPTMVAGKWYWQDVLKWLRSRTTAFCVHTPDDGTAIPVFILKVTQEERVWVFFKVVSPNTEDGGTGLDERMRASDEACLPHNVFGELQSSEVEKAPKSLSKLSRNAGELGV
ncbi:hypothetical protein PQX77_019815 [Marasmius sp. AFHP31]|nr:hypothetical protein PQX77_019815 [Marasmius sp. AFHP31]